MLPRSLINLAVCFFLTSSTGCATSAPIAMGRDTYLISQTSAGGAFKSMSSLKAEVMMRANEFAESKGKVAIPIAGKESPSYPGHMPNFEYQFRLVDANDPLASGSALPAQADVVIEKRETNSTDIRIKDQSEKSKDIYAELFKLDDLRKKGIITEEEFEAQKKKVLTGN